MDSQAPDLSLLPCKVCDVFIPSGAGNFALHVGGAKHQKALAKAAAEAAELDSQQSTLIKCPVCLVNVNGESNFAQHARGAMHQDALKAAVEGAGWDFQSKFSALNMGASGSAPAPATAPGQELNVSPFFETFKYLWQMRWMYTRVAILFGGYVGHSGESGLFWCLYTCAHYSFTNTPFSIPHQQRKYRRQHQSLMLRPSIMPNLH